MPLNVSDAIDQIVMGVHALESAYPDALAKSEGMQLVDHLRQAVSGMYDQLQATDEFQSYEPKRMLQVLYRRLSKRASDTSVLPDAQPDAEYTPVYLTERLKNRLGFALYRSGTLDISPDSDLTVESAIEYAQQLLESETSE